MDIIVAMDGTVLFGVRYHGWIIATRDEQILLCGGGPGDGLADLISSYRSELGGIMAGLATLGTFQIEQDHYSISMISMRQRVSCISGKRTHHRQHIFQHERRLGPNCNGAGPIGKLVK
jgi:hypothetical protein